MRNEREEEKFHIWATFENVSLVSVWTETLEILIFYFVVFLISVFIPFVERVVIENHSKEDFNKIRVIESVDLVYKCVPNTRN